MDADVAVIGAGMAGASAAYELAATHRVLLLEREDQPGYHTTGRSAAVFTEAYGNGPIRTLTIGSRPFLEQPPPGFADHPLMRPLGVIQVADRDGGGACDRQLAAAAGFVDRAGRPLLFEIDRAEARRLLPLLRADVLDRALYEPDARDMDAHAIHHGFLKGLRARSGRLVTGAEVTALAPRAGAWHLATRAGDIVVARVVNAAGAWADEIARLASVRPIGLQPMRRTAMIIDGPAGADMTGWPMCNEVAEAFYFKPDAGRLLASPEDEIPSPPCDAQPEDVDIAMAVEKLHRWTTLKIERIGRKWAGLRSFVADRTPVVGEAAEAPGFFWLAGQGGYGIMTAPAMARAAAAAVRGERLPADLAALGLGEGALGPARLR